MLVIGQAEEVAARSLEYLSSRAHSLKGSAVIQASYDSLTVVLPELRDGLLKMRSERAQQLADLQESKVQGEADFVDAAVQRGALAALADIDEALERIDAGRYGACGSCGGEISAARLEFRPMAVNCAECQARVERASA